MCKYNFVSNHIFNYHTKYRKAWVFHFRNAFFFRRMATTQTSHSKAKFQFNGGCRRKEKKKKMKKKNKMIKLVENME